MLEMQKQKQLVKTAELINISYCFQNTEDLFETSKTYVQIAGLE